MSRGARGGSLIGAVLGGLVLCLLALSIGGIASMQLQTSSSIANRNNAQNLAESVLHLAIRELLRNQDFGKAGKPGFAEVLRWRCPGEDEYEACLTFDPAQARRLGIPVSYNNFGRDAPAQSPSGQVPKQAVKLLAVGHYRARRECVEVILTTPVMNHVVSSSGNVVGRGETLIARVKGVSSVDADGQVVAAELLPGAVSSASLRLPMDLGDRTLVKGDALAAGRVQLGPQARVEGQVQEGVVDSPVPRLNVDNYNPSSRHHELLASDVLDGATRLSGSFLRKGDLEAPVLDLDGAVLFVDGNLKAGQIRGKGAVFVTGRAELAGASQLSSDNALAVASKGDLTITGAGSRSFFQGLVYTEGNFQADSITMLGTLVANKAGGSHLELRNARVYATSTPRVEFSMRGVKTVTLKGVVFFDSIDGHVGELSQEMAHYDKKWWNASVLAAQNLAVGQSAPVTFDVKHQGWARNFGEEGFTTVVDAEPTDTGTFVLDFNDMLSAAERMRIVYWKRAAFSGN